MLLLLTLVPSRPGIPTFGMACSGPWLYGLIGKNRVPLRTPLTRAQMLSLVDHYPFKVVAGPFADWDALMDHVEGGGALLDGEAVQARGRELRGEVRAAWLAGFEVAPMEV